MENLEKTISEKIKLVRQSLKEKDFSKASVYCKEIINRDPENAEAYLDLFYAENEVVNHKEYEDKKLAQTAEPVLTKHEIFLPQEELDNLRNYGEYNSFDTSILDRPHAIEYFTETESREAQLAEVQEYFENNENLQKAIQFTKRGEAASINLMKMILFREMQKRIDQAKEQDALAAEQAQEQVPFKKREIMNAMMEGGMVDGPAYSEPAETNAEESAAEETENVAVDGAEADAEESTDDTAAVSADAETTEASETEASDDLIAEDGEETLFTGTLPDGYDTVDAKTVETDEDNKDMVTDYEIDSEVSDDDEDEDDEDDEDEDEDDEDDDESEQLISEEEEIGEDGVPIIPAPPKEFVKLPEIEENYQEACSLLKTGRAGLRKIYKSFEALGDYKDSKEKLEEVKGLMLDRKRHLAGLKDEKRDIMSTFPKLNAFQAKKKKELEARLVQINQEIDDLTVETEGYPVFDENM